MASQLFAESAAWVYGIAIGATHGREHDAVLEVQNWPTPSVMDPESPAALRCSARCSSAWGRMKTGLTLLIFGVERMGSRARARDFEQLETAAARAGESATLMAGCATRACATAWPSVKSSERKRLRVRRFWDWAAARNGAAAHFGGSEVRVNAAFTMTGRPAAKAEAGIACLVTENASGKLLAQKTATGPTGRSMERRSARGSGLRSGSARLHARHRPTSLQLDDSGVVLELSGGACEFTADTRFGQRGFGHHAMDERVAEGFKVGGDLAQEGERRLARGKTRYSGMRRPRRCAAWLRDPGRVGAVERGFEGLAGGRVHGVEGFAGGRGAAVSDDRGALQIHNPVCAFRWPPGAGFRL